MKESWTRGIKLKFTMYLFTIHANGRPRYNNQSRKPHAKNGTNQTETTTTIRHPPQDQVQIEM